MSFPIETSTRRYLKDIFAAVARVFFFFFFCWIDMEMKWRKMLISNPKERSYAADLKMCLLYAVWVHVTEAQNNVFKFTAIHISHLLSHSMSESPTEIIRAASIRK